MSPQSGKSTLSYVIAGKEDYEVLDGEILLNGENVLEMEADARAAATLTFSVDVESGAAFTAALVGAPSGHSSKSTLAAAKSLQVAPGPLVARRSPIACKYASVSASS